MPIPVPKSEDDLGACIRALRREGYTDNEQRVAICLSMYRKEHGKKEPEKKSQPIAQQGQ
jgi:hypothetical protein